MKHLENLIAGRKKILKDCVKYHLNLTHLNLHFSLEITKSMIHPHLSLMPVLSLIFYELYFSY